MPVKRVGWILRGTTSTGIVVKDIASFQWTHARHVSTLRAYRVRDWAGTTETRKPTGRYLVPFNGGLVARHSFEKRYVAESTMEAG